MSKGSGSVLFPLHSICFQKTDFAAVIHLLLHIADFICVPTMQSRQSPVSAVEVKKLRNREPLEAASRRKGFYRVPREQRQIIESYMF